MAQGQSDWRAWEPGLAEGGKRHPKVSPFVILKTDVQRRGAVLTERARRAIRPEKDSTLYRGINLESNADIPWGFLLRDGTSVLCTIEAEDPDRFERTREPYTIDYVDGKHVLADEGKALEAITWIPTPAYTWKKTRKGTPMWQVLIARPQRMDINLYQTCDFWKDGGMGCRFCVAGATMKATKHDKAEIPDLDDIEDAVREALKQPGRYRSVFLCSGTILTGAEPQDDEVNLYIEMLQRVGKYFTERKVMSQIVATAFTEKQLRRLHDETMLCGYTADLEVLDEELFSWICPGKAKHIGYREWRERLYRAADIFGPGRVSSGVVSGVEMAQPHGFSDEDEALRVYLAEAENLARHGVSISQQIFHVEPGSVFFRQRTATLEYLTAFAEGLDALSRKYGLTCHCDDYLTCGNHPNTDMARAWQGGGR